MHWVIQRKVVLGFGGALISLIAISLYAFNSLVSSSKASAWVKHTLEVENRLELLLSTLKNAEIGERDYIITGNEQYLNPYHTAIENVMPQFQFLRQLTADNPAQQARLDALQPLIVAKLTSLNQNITLRRSRGFEAAARTTSVSRGKRIMDDIRRLVGQMEAMENTLLKQRAAEAQTLSRMTTLVTVLGAVLAAGTVTAATISLNQDISRRIQVEEQLRILRDHLEEQVRKRTAQLEAASLAKDEFLSVLSHELRTPLNAILGWIQLLRRGKLDPAKATQGLEVIERNARSQARLIEDILDISRIIQGKLRLRVRSVEPVAVVEAAIEAIRPAAEARSIRIQAVLDSSAGPVSGDPERLQQVVWNLLSNAVKFTPKQGRVQVRLERINSHIEITVSDTGKGISAEFLPYIFDRFRQADSTTTRSYSGLGLGLAIVRQLVELHGGMVRAVSPGEGQGATFIITLPLMIIHSELVTEQRVHPQTGGEVPFHHSSSLAGLRILVVDDEADARNLLVTVLEHSGASTVAVASAAEALDILRHQRVDLLLSDIGMPQQDGYELIRQVRQLAPEAGGTIPAVALTAYARVEDRIRALSEGFQMHVPKPIEPAELVTVVKNLTERLSKT